MSKFKIDRLTIRVKGQAGPAARPGIAGWTQALQTALGHPPQGPVNAGSQILSRMQAGTVVHKPGADWQMHASLKIAEWLRRGGWQAPEEMQ